MSKKLAGKNALVTGASKGIGAEIARELAAHGAVVVVNYASSKTDADRVVADIIRDGGNAVTIQADVASPADITRLFADARKATGQLDILVNNAGIYEFAPLDKIVPEHFHKMFNVNVLGPLLTTQEALEHFNPTGGAVINISSLAGLSPFPETSVYSATKAALNSITRTLAQELGPRQIRVNAILPGMVLTEGVRTAGIDQSEFRSIVESRTPLGRVGQPSDIAPAVVFLASAEAGWITGETLVISGGMR